MLLRFISLSGQVIRTASLHNLPPVAGMMPGLVGYSASPAMLEIQLEDGHSIWVSSWDEFPVGQAVQVEFIHFPLFGRICWSVTPASGSS